MFRFLVCSNLIFTMVSKSVILFVSLSFCLFVCLFVCLFLCLFVCFVECDFSICFTDSGPMGFITTFHNYLGDFIQACSTHQTVANPGFWVLQRPRKFCGMSRGSDPKVNAHMFKIPHEKFPHIL